jgi:hypothetical protein
MDLKLARKELIKNKHNYDLYFPILKLFNKYKTPLSIKEISKYTKFGYQTTKERLFVIYKFGFIRRLKRGIYSNIYYVNKIKNKLNESDKLVKINAGVRISSSSNGINILVYNSSFRKKRKCDYCSIEEIDDKTIKLRVSDKYSGRKIYFGKSCFISTPRNLIPKISKIITTKVKPIKLLIYPSEWGLSDVDIYGTESIQEGLLAKELMKYGEVDNPGRIKELKIDLFFIKNGIKYPIEITTTTPTCFGYVKKRSTIKSYCILSRMYYSIKWFSIHKTKSFIVISDKWKNFEWMKKEIDFVKKFKVNIIFTSFKDNWFKRTASVINNLT